jgi:hypothetical protein
MPLTFVEWFGLLLEITGTAIPPTSTVIHSPGPEVQYLVDCGVFSKQIDADSPHAWSVLVAEEPYPKQFEVEVPLGPTVLSQQKCRSTVSARAGGA